MTVVVVLGDEDGDGEEKMASTSPIRLKFLSLFLGRISWKWGIEWKVSSMMKRLAGGRGPGGWGLGIGDVRSGAYGYIS